MAIWQFDFYIVEKGKMIAEDDETTIWSNGFHHQMPQISYLPSKPSYSENIRQFGDLDSDCMCFFTEDDEQICEVEVRLDLRKITMEKIDELLEYIREMGAEIFCDNRIMKPSRKTMVECIKQSKAFSFCANPVKFLDELL